MTEEEWRDVPGYEGRYQVSNTGKVKSLARSCRSPRPRPVREKILKPWSTPDEYIQVKLFKNGDHKTFKVHVLVAVAFIGPCPLGMEVRHYPDRTRTNNNLTNLSYGTRKQNLADRIEHGTHNRGECHPVATKTNAEIQALREEYFSGTSQDDLAAKYDLSRGYVSRVVNYKMRVNG